jgi:thioredoxin 1
MVVHKITDQSFDQDVLQNPMPTLVDFWAQWCMPCQTMGSVLESVAKELAGKVNICKLNIDENPDTPVHYNVRSIPTLILFKNGQKIDTHVGTLTHQALVDWINQRV